MLNGANMKKLLLRLFIVLIILVVLVVVGLGLFLDSGIKKAVETIGPQIAKVEVKLGGVSLSILSGAGKIKGLVVGNPEGYKTPHAATVGSASVAVVPGSLFSEKIVIKSIRVEAAEIIYEGGLLGGDNLHKILDNVSAASGSSEPNTSKNGKPKKLQVDDFVISGAKVIVSLKGAGGFSAPITLPEIHLTNLGQGPEGITPGELTKKVLTIVTESVVKNAANAIADIGKGVTDTATKAASGAVEKTTKGIGDLFKKKP